MSCVCEPPGEVGTTRGLAWDCPHGVRWHSEGGHLWSIWKREPEWKRIARQRRERRNRGKRFGRRQRA